MYSWVISITRNLISLVNAIFRACSVCPHSWQMAGRPRSFPLQLDSAPSLFVAATDCTGNVQSGFPWENSEDCYPTSLSHVPSFPAQFA